jgi:hypothetical protein
MSGIRAAGSFRRGCRPAQMPGKLTGLIRADLRNHLGGRVQPTLTRHVR